MKRAIFVTGTDTGIGKTVVSGLLARYFLKKGGRVITQKWVQTGSSLPGLPLDIKTHLKIMGKDKNYIKSHLDDVIPYVFKFPASPHLAAKIEGRVINESKIIKSFKRLSSEFDYVIVEGTGGVLVPLNRKHLIVDLVAKLNLSVLLVAGNKLGSINHTLMSIEALKKRKLNIIGIVFNNMPGENKIILEDNCKIIKELSGEKVLGVLPWLKNRDQLYTIFSQFAGKITEGS